MRDAIPLILLLTACGGGGPIDSKLPEDTGDDVLSGAPNLISDVSSIDFGGVFINETVTDTVLLTNNGLSKLVISGVDVDEPFSTTFGSRLELNAGTSTSLTVKYHPTDYSRDELDMVITSDDPDQPTLTISLAGGVISDEDDDGYDSEAAGGPDCDDTDADVNPDAEDTWYDGVDSDCAGDSDWDQDGDGYEASTHNDDPLDNGGDCLDINDEVHPGATETWYDGVDQDCDGQNDYDQDGDGDYVEPRGSDCDDLDASANTDAVEVFDFADDDCDDIADIGIAGWNSDLIYTGKTSSAYFGAGVAVGDLDGDGLDDLLVGGSGEATTSGSGVVTGGVAVYMGDALPATESTFTDGGYVMSATSSTEKAGGEVVFLDDCTGDGDPDVAVGAVGANVSQGRVYVTSYNKYTSSATLSSASGLIINGASGSSGLGAALAADLDLDVDGTDDLAGSYVVTSSGSSLSYLWVQYGGEVTGTLALGSVDARFSTDGKDGTPRGAFPGTGDLNGDGADDLVFCDAQSDDAGATRGGAVWVVWGSATQVSNTSAADIGGYATVVAGGGTTSEQLGYQCGVVSDVDGDGADELVVYAAGDDHKGLYLFPGSSSWSSTLDTDSASVAWSMSSSLPDVDAIRDAGDLDKDGDNEIAVAMGSGSSSVSGRVYFYDSATAAGTYDAEDEVMATIEGDGDYDQSEYGDRIPARPGDIDGDGYVDWIAADSGYSSNLGAVYLTYSPGDR